MTNNLITIIPDVHGRPFWKSALQNLGRSCHKNQIV